MGGIIRYEKSFIREWTEVIVVAFMVAMIVQTFFTKPFKIPSGSMMDTLQVGDMIFVNRFSYWFTTPKRGDVIVFKYPENPKLDFIKRVIATEGETLDIKDYNVYVDGKKLTEPYIREPTEERGVISFPFKVPKGNVFVCGDNRNNSKDSRYWGPLQLNAIKGKAFIIYWYNRNRHGGNVNFNPWNLLRIQFIR